MHGLLSAIGNGALLELVKVENGGLRSLNGVSYSSRTVFLAPATLLLKVAVFTIVVYLVYSFSL